MNMILVEEKFRYLELKEKHMNYFYNPKAKRIPGIKKHIYINDLADEAKRDILIYGMDPFITIESSQNKLVAAATKARENTRDPRELRVADDRYVIEGPRPPPAQRQESNRRLPSSTINVHEESLFAEPSFHRDQANNSSAVRLHFEGASALDHGNRWVTTRPISKGNKERIKNHAALLDIVSSKPEGPVLREENFYGKRPGRKLRNSNAYLNAERPKVMLRKRSVQQ